MGHTTHNLFMLGFLGEAKKSRQLAERQFRWEQQQAAAQLAEAQMGPMERQFRDHQRTQMAMWNALSPAEQQALLAARGAPPIKTRPPGEVAAQIWAVTVVVATVVGAAVRTAALWVAHGCRRWWRKFRRRV